ncbi:kinase [Selenomonas sp.]|uniref:GHMP family kinase ATP-binding protein n=1 Tax=Selenomonas sp. TaxID=2053611 RepID=UPI002A75ADF7|nr:kinase [Selenomonas sp.]MDY3298648.1 kinase [Selenomonas sp.]MDY4417003.1 kinase [Selenomonas sp.]
MIITKTPFRISFCGGGSDLSSFYRQHEGCVLSTSINKYCYIVIHPYFDEHQTLLKYSQTELVDDIRDIQHRIFRCVLNDYGLHGVEIVSTADVPAGTGLGSSSTFTVGLLHAVNSYHGKFVSKGWLAKEACKVEIEKLGSPIGKQDQYAAAFGGLNFIRFHADESVSVEPIVMQPETYRRLDANLILFYTGLKHDANAILSKQSANMSQTDKVASLRAMTQLARDMKAALEANDLSSFGRILDEGWQRKRTLANGITRPEIDAIYAKAMRSGALGGKLLGAGGGGFFLFYCEQEQQERLRAALGLRAFDFHFERDGSSVIYIGDKYWD